MESKQHVIGLELNENTGEMSLELFSGGAKEPLRIYLDRGIKIETINKHSEDLNAQLLLAKAQIEELEQRVAELETANDR